MSIVAKVFVVINLLLSITFLVFAMLIWTARTKWQKMYEQERMMSIEMKSKFQSRFIELSKAVVQREEVIKQKVQQITTQKLRLNDQTDQILQLNSRIGEAESRVQMWQAVNEELVRENNRRADELVRLRGVLLKQQQAVEVARDNEVKAKNIAAELENELHSKTTALAEVQRQKRSIEEDLNHQTYRIHKLMDAGVPISQIIGEDVQATQGYVPDALVLAVQPDINLVMLSVGSAQGVKPGFQFTISRGDKYLSLAQVQRVYPDMCSAILKSKVDEVQVHDEAKGSPYAAR